MKYVELVIANNSDTTDQFYTYGCQFDDVMVGQKVFAPFNRGNKLKEAYVFKVHDELNENIKGLKYVDSIDEGVCLSEEAIATCIWMKRRYSCRYIDAINCFTPSGTSSKRGKKRRPLKDVSEEVQLAPKLTDEQVDALSKIVPYIKENKHNIFLMHGITGSGKTEIYMQTIEKCISAGKTAIMLVPEISLTPQIIDRFIGRFGKEDIAVLHSKLSLGERYDEWRRIQSGQVKIVIGARSAVFAPLENIGVVILDEEHESTYKSDKTPKYDTVEIAIKRVKAQDKKGIVLLGSATPSVVSRYRAKEGIYELLELTKRYNEVKLPTAIIIDMRDELKNGNKSVLSKVLYNEMLKCLAEGLQVILFLNRRGYATFVNCRECGYVMKCQDCNIAHTYHKAKNLAVCHYCGIKEKMPESCPECKSKYIRHFGVGTEKVEEEVKLLFPQYETDRLDLDTIKKKGDIEKVLGSFKKGNTQILIGTQLVAKGLDFENVGLVGVISADTTLNIPDFRSSEKTFQLITQAAGRAGRGNEIGKVIIQTYTPDHYAIEAASEHNYEQFYEAEISLRKLMKYPPYTDLIQILITAESDEEAVNAAQKVFEELKTNLNEKDGQNVFPPQLLTFFKQNGVRYQILIKSEQGKRNVYLDIIAEIKKRIASDKDCKYSLGVDVNPFSFI